MGSMDDPFMRQNSAAVQGRTKGPNRANIIQAKLIGQSHPTGLTPNLLKLFQPRLPLEYKPPLEKKKCPSYTGMAQFVSNFAEPGEPEYAPPPKKGETSAQKRERIHKLRLENGAKKAAEELEKYDPPSDPNISGDPYKTLFVARLNYDTTEKRIKREFETYGPIKKVRMVTDTVSNKPRGYAFIEYVHTRDMKSAYKQADGRKLDNRRVLVDVERGRTVPNWRPRRLGGGLGSTRIGGEEVNMKYSGREPQQLTSGGPSRSEEPRARVEQLVDREREKSRDRGRDRDREKSRERSDDRELRDDSHHRDRDRRGDRDRERTRDRRDHDRSRGDRDRGGRDYDRKDRARDPDRERDRDRRKRPRDSERDDDRSDRDRDRGRSRNKDERDDRDRDYVEPAAGGYKLPENENGGMYEEPQEQGQYDPPQDDRYDHGPERKYGRYDQSRHEDYNED
ncbi:hypothetical protein ACHQM5_016374 [Ranunculus cassubicifolius]